MWTAVIAILLLAFATNPSDARDRTVRRAAMACRTEQLIERSDALYKAGGGEWNSAYMMTVLNSGECTWLKAGTKVAFERERTRNPKYVIVRPAGQTGTVVTFRRIFD